MFDGAVGVGGGFLDDLPVQVLGVLGLLVRGQLVVWVDLVECVGEGVDDVGGVVGCPL